MPAVQFKDYYKTLELGRSATQEEIKSAYKRLARTYHPDLNPGDQSAEERFKEINEAQEVLAAAFTQNVTDIIAFDYWNGDLNELKAEARLAAVDAAREKADVVLGAVFDERPAPINVQEETTVHYPESLYQSFTSAVDQSVAPSFRRDIPFIRASRPQNTYYRGLYPNADVQPRELPMKPEISVVSTVRIYFESPAAQREEADNDQGRKTKSE